MKKISIIIPAHNEQATILAVLKKVVEINLLPWQKEIIVVDDGSTDETGQIIKQWASLPGNDAHCLVFSHAKNLGKGAAIQTGLRHASGDYVIIQDADLEYNPSDIPKLLAALKDGAKVESFDKVVFGARGNKVYPQRGFHYVVGAWILTTFYNLFFWQKLTDLYTGYKLIPTKIFKELGIKSKGFEFEAEVACKLVKANVKIIEVPITYQPRNKIEGKHIGFKDAFFGLWAIIKYRM